MPLPTPPMILLAAGGVASVFGRFVLQRITIPWGMYFAISLFLSACSLGMDPLGGNATAETFDIHRAWINDRLAAPFQWLILLFGLLTGAAVFKSSVRQHNQSQICSFLLFAVAALMLVACANDFLSLGMSLEIASLAVVAFRRCTETESKTEPTTSDFVLHSDKHRMSELWSHVMVSGWMWLGIALFSNSVATTQFDAIRLVLSETTHDRAAHALMGIPSKLILFAAGLMMMSLIGRIGLVPFHLMLVAAPRHRMILPWGFAVISGQFAGSMALSRLSGRVFVGLGDPTIVLLTVVSVATFFMSSVMAVRGFAPGLKSIPRWLTSLVLLQSGWLVCGIMIATAELEHPDLRWGAFPQQHETLDYVIFSQIAGLLALWSIIVVLDSLSRFDRGIEFLEDVKGLWQVTPVASATLLISLASSIGVPWTAGFWGRWFTMLAGSNVHIKSTSSIFEPHMGIRMVILAGTVATVFAASAVIRIAREMILESFLSRTHASSGRRPLVVGLIAAMGSLLLGASPQVILRPLKSMETPHVPRIDVPVKGSGKNRSVFWINSRPRRNRLGTACQARSARQVQRQFVISTKLACCPWQSSTCWAQFCPVWSGTSLPDHQPREDNPFILVDPDS